MEAKKKALEVATDHLNEPRLKRVGWIWLAVLIVALTIWGFAGYGFWSFFIKGQGAC